MTEGIAISSFDLAMLIGRGLFILLALRGLAYLIELSPIRRSRKELLRALGPLFVVFVCVAFLMSAVQQLFGAHAAVLPLMLGAVVVGCVVALWAPIRDMLAGVFLRAGRVANIGDELQVGELHGRVEHLGYRRLLLRTNEGEAIVPYSLISRAAIVREKSRRGAAAYTFRVRPIAGVPLVELRREIQHAALLCHWSSLGRPPELATAEQGAVDVTVFAIDAVYAPEIEAAVRQRLSNLEQARGGQAASLLPLPAGDKQLGAAPTREPESSS